MMNLERPNMNKHTIYDDAPWFHPKAIPFLSSLLKPDWVMLETGCGSSTIWFAKRVKKVISFEHSKLYYDLLKKLIEDKGIKNVDLRLRPDYPRRGLRDFNKDEFDFVSIDGIWISRNRCVKNILPCLKSGGYLLLDDSEYRRYNKAKILLNNWESNVFGNNHLHATTIWRKP